MLLLSININLKNIFINHIFALFKYYRTFDGIKNNMTTHNSVDISIREYISENVFSRYKISDFKLYIKYNDLQNSIGLINNNNFNKDGILGYNVDNMELKHTSNNMEVIFNQLNNPNAFNFDYYFDFKFIKI